MLNKYQKRKTNEDGVAAVELALVLPILLIIVFGILDFGLYFYNDLQLTHVARDAARHLSVGDEAAASATIGNALLISTTIDSQSLDAGTTAEDATVTLTATYQTLTPLPALVGIGNTLGIDATAIMRRE
ncbi:MAG: hypothetical protein Kow00129_12690 [Thermoleophilia bacterium]